jgi:hypothetical protein
MRAASRAGPNLIAALAMSACSFAQTPNPPQPWAAKGEWSATVTQGALYGPLAVDSSGDLLVAGALVGATAPTKILGSSQNLSWISKINASGAPVF